MRRWVLWFLAVAVILGGMRWGAAGAAPDVVTIRLVLTGETRGLTELCGCSPEQTGGLPRRAAYLRGLGGPLVLIDTGNIFPPPDHLALPLKVAQVAAYYGQAGYDAVALTSADLALDRVTLAAMATRVPFVSWPEVELGGTARPPAYRRLEVAGKTVAVGALRGDEAGDDLAPFLARLATEEEGADALVTIVDRKDGGLPNLGFGIGRRHLFIVPGGTSMQLISGARVVGIPRDFADAVGTLEVRLGGDGLEVSELAVHRLGPTVEDDPETRDLLARVRDSVVDRLPKAKQVPLAPPYAGAARCAGCHPAAFAVWQKSRHAHALDVLTAKDAHRRPDCVVCHTLGFDRTSTTYQAPGVSCESCHGPARDHADRAGGVKTPHRDARAQCTRCHNREESPTFYFPDYWSLIEHGR